MTNKSQSSEKSPHWDSRFSEPGYAYGEEPNDFVVEMCQAMHGGDALSLCEGEGRNAVYLARLGFRVTAVDFSEVGLAKARALADKHGVTINTIVADLADFDPGIGRWDLVLSIFAQPPSAVRQGLYRRMHQALRAQGKLVLETKVEANAAGDSRYPGAQILGTEMAPLRIAVAREQERELREGRYHLGLQRTAQIVAVNDAVNDQAGK
ncbi:MAG TPA: class I SAM-dependent methyltransferase [Herbaspirillum sp.]|jgi:SAM-dependent methyltransferase